MTKKVTKDDLKALLRRHKVSQRTAALLCEVNQKTMERWCQGVHEVTYITYMGVKAILESGDSSSPLETDQT